MEPGKIFVGGLDWNTDRDALHTYFATFGEVTDCIVMKNNQTGKSRGFGFVTFSDPDAVNVVLAKKHSIDGRNVDAKACSARGSGGGRAPGQKPGGFAGKTTKIFVGGLPNDANEENLKNFFGTYGEVTNVAIMYDPEKERPRGFGFLTFANEEAVEAAVKEHFLEFLGKKIEVKYAEPRQGGRGRQNFYGDQGWGDGGNWNQNYGNYGGPQNYGGYGSQGYEQGGWGQQQYGGQVGETENWGGPNQQGFNQNYGQGGSYGFSGPNQSYGGSSQGYASPNQGYGSGANQAYGGTNQAYGSQSYGGAGASQNYNGNPSYGNGSQSYGGSHEGSYSGAGAGYQAKAQSGGGGSSGGSQGQGYHPYKR